MTQPQREQLADLLRGNIPLNVPLIEDAIAHDIESVEPFIDDLVQQGEIRGKLEAWFHGFVNRPKKFANLSVPTPCGARITAAEKELKQQEKERIALKIPPEPKWKEDAPSEPVEQLSGHLECPKGWHVEPNRREKTNHAVCVLNKQ